MVQGFKKGKKFIPTKKRSGVSSSITGLKGYNVKLKKSEVIRNPVKVTMKNGRHAVKGLGSDGTPIFRIVAN